MRNIGLDQGRTGKPFVDAEVRWILRVLAAGMDQMRPRDTARLCDGTRSIDEVISDEIIPRVELAGEKENITAKQQ